MVGHAHPPFTPPPPTTPPTTPPTSAPSGFTFDDAPALAGQPRAGSRVRLTGVSRGNVTPRPSTITVRWFAGGKQVKGATKKAYTVRRSDVGKRLEVKVTMRGGAPTTSYAVRSPRVVR